MDWVVENLFWLVPGGIGLLGVIFMAGRWVGKADESLAELKKTTKSTNKTLKKIVQALKGMDSKLDTLIAIGSANTQSLAKIDALVSGGMTAGRSPLGLKPIGKKVFKGVNGPELVERYYRKVEIPENASSYGIQERCLHYALNGLEGDLNAEDKLTVEDYAFEAGVSKYDVFTTLGIKFRDKLLEAKKAESAKAESAKAQAS